MTLGKIEEILDEIEFNARKDYKPETFKYILEVLNNIREELNLDKSNKESREENEDY